MFIKYKSELCAIYFMVMLKRLNKYNITLGPPIPHALEH